MAVIACLADMGCSSIGAAQGELIRIEREWIEWARWNFVHKSPRLCEMHDEIERSLSASRESLVIGRIVKARAELAEACRLLDFLPDCERRRHEVAIQNIRRAMERR
jgi:hypothetical protein